MKQVEEIAANKKETIPASNCIVTVFKIAHAQKKRDISRMTTPKVLSLFEEASWRDTANKEARNEWSEVLRQRKLKTSGIAMPASMTYF